MSLSSSECEPLSLQELLSYSDDEGREIWDQLSLGYVEPSNGSPYLRREILRAQFCDKNNITLEEESVNVCAPQEGIFLTLHALCEPGDHAIVVAPAYQSLHEIAVSIGCEVDFWWPEQRIVNVLGQEQNSFWFDPATLQKLLRPTTKLVVANFPHNPTGALPTQQEFQEMVEMIRDHTNQPWFLVDEMYRGLEHPQPSQEQEQNPHRLPSVATCLERGISLGGVSKSYGLPGLRIGWVVSSDLNFQQRIAQLKDYTSICPPAPSEALAFVALRAQTALWERSRNILAEQLTQLRQFITVDLPQLSLSAEYQWEWCEPLGGTFAWIKFHGESKNTSVRTVSDYCDGIRKRTGLMMIPSDLFPELTAATRPETTKVHEDRIRLTFGRKGLPELLEVWRRDLERHA